MIQLCNQATNSMGQNSFSEAVNSQEMTVCSPNVHYHIHKSSSLASIVSRLNSVTISNCSFELNFNIIILYLCVESSLLCVGLGLSTKILYAYVTSAFNVIYPAHQIGFKLMMKVSNTNIRACNFCHPPVS